MTERSQAVKRTEESDSKDDVEPILLEEGLFQLQWDRITGLSQRRRNTELWSIREIEVKRRLGIRTTTTNNGGWPGTEKEMVAFLGKVRTELRG
jgi:hypothetical protein